MRKVWKIAMISLVALTLLAACSNEDSRSVANVGGEKITEAELNEMLQKQNGDAMLDTLISYKIVEQEAKKAKLEISEEEIDEEYVIYADQYGGNDMLLEMLKKYNMSEEDVREDIRIYLLTKKLLANEVDVTDEEMESYFKENKESFTSDMKVTISQIIVEDEELAHELIHRIEDGEDFAKLAKEYSIEEYVNETGGSAGTFGRGEMDAEIEAVVFSLAEGMVTQEPIETESGYHIILLEDKIEGETVEFEEVKEEIHDRLVEEKVDEVYPSWLEKKYEEYEVKKTLFK